MFQSTWAREVGRFANLTQAIPDSALGLDWSWGAYDSEGVRFAFFRTYEDLQDLAVKARAGRLAQGIPLTSAQRILALYHAAYRDMQAALLGVDAELAARAPAEGEWPVQKVVAHIVGADLGFYGVVRYALDRFRTGDGRPAEIPEDAWDGLIGEDEATTVAVLEGPFDALLTYGDAFHARVIGELADIADEELDLHSRFWEGHDLSLRFRLHRFDSHLRQHTIQIDKALQAIGQRASEPRQLLRLIYAAMAAVEAAAIGGWDIPAEPARQLAEVLASRTDELVGILAQR